MKKIFVAATLSAALFMASCGGANNTTEKKESATTESSTSANAATSNRIVLLADDAMRFDKTVFTVKAGDSITLTLKNIGKMPKESMGHNVVVLMPGTDLASFAAASLQGAAGEYLPKEATSVSKMVAHTKLLGPGESDEIKFLLPNKGTFPFICSFPGHYGPMQGTIVAQ